MTREEAIKALKWFKEYNEEDYCGGDRIQDKNGDWYYYITERDFEAFDMAIKALEQAPKAKIALNRYRDLQDYFSDEAVAKTILKNQREFKSWLKRLKWNTKKVDELARKLEALEQEPILDKIRAEIQKLRNCSCTCSDGIIDDVEDILDKYKVENEDNK